MNGLWKRKNKYPVKVMLSIAVAGSIFSGALFNEIKVSAKSTSDIQNEIYDIEKEKQKNKKEQDKVQDEREREQQELKDLKGQQNDLKNDVKNINGDINSVKKDISDIEGKIASNSNSLSSLEEEKTAAEERMSRVKKEMAVRMKYAYETYSTDSAFTVLMSSGSFAEFLSRAEYMSQLAKRDKYLMESLDEAKKTIDEKSAKIKSEQDDLTANQEELAVKQTELSQILAQAQGELDQKTGEVKKQELTVAEFDARLKEIEKKSQSIASREAAAQEAILAEVERNSGGGSAGGEAGGGSDGSSGGGSGGNSGGGTAPPVTGDHVPIPVVDMATTNRHSGIAPGSYGTYQPGTFTYDGETFDEREMLYALVMAESGNQGLVGQRAVASVVMNRVYSRYYGQNTIGGVITAQNQFQPVSNGAMRLYYDNPSRITPTVRQAVNEVLAGQQFYGQMYFMTPAAFAKQTWIWKNGRIVCDYQQTGGHVFFNVLTSNIPY